MNQNKLEDVGDLVDVDSSNLSKNGFRKKITLVHYYLIQFGFFIFSSLVGLAFGFYSWSIAAYPYRDYSGFTQRYLYGSIILVLTHGSNSVLAFRFSRKKRLILNKTVPKVLSPWYIFPPIFLNFVLSALSLFVIHNLVLNPRITVVIAYGVYNRKKLKDKIN